MLEKIRSLYAEAIDDLLLHRFEMQNDNKINDPAEREYDCQLFGRKQMLEQIMSDIFGFSDDEMKMQEEAISEGYQD